MNPQDIYNASNDCPVDEIAAYIDGELSADRESKIEMHFAECRGCSVELNQQKQFLCALDNGLRRADELELPADFTRLIVANAESSVSGLRRPAERLNALFICSALFLFLLVALGAEAGDLLPGIVSLLDQIAVVGGILGHLIYAVFLGISIILRTLSSQVSFDGIIMGTLAIASVLMTLFVSRKLMPARRA